jgi:ABC-type multidrug transport system fused ATPase/permease subunit
MPSEFEPILKQKLSNTNGIEQFVSESESTSIVGSIFMGIGLMVLAMLITWLFLWSYQKEKLLFIVVLSVVVFLYSVEMVAFIALQRGKLSPLMFRIFMGSSVMISIMCIILIIVFSIKASQRLRGRSSYVPGPVQDYIEPNVN